MINNPNAFHTDCPDHDLLEQFGHGAIEGERLIQLAEHLDQCARCCTLLSRQDDCLDRVISALRDQSIHHEQADVKLADLMGRQSIDSGAVHVDTSIESGTQTDRLSDEAVPVIANYDVQRLIGRGGMGTVYSAIHSNLDRPVAIKVLAPARQADELAVARFRSEMKAVGRANHPNIVQAVDAGQSDGILYLAMELIVGLNVSDLLHRGGSMNAADAWEIVRQAALGLHHAHEQNLIHRDIKPSKLMLAIQSESRISGDFDVSCKRIHGRHRVWVSQQPV